MTPFQIPTRRLQKPIIVRGNNLLDSIAEFIEIKKHTNDTKKRKQLCNTPSSPSFEAAESIKRMWAARKALRTVTKVDIECQDVLLSNIQALDRKKKELQLEVEKIERNYLQNLKYRENDKLETLSKIQGYIDSTRQIKKEKEKQDILIRIGLIMEALMYELAPYEEILGRLSLQENAFKSKADTLAIKKNILMIRMKELNAQLKKNLFRCEELKKQLFKTCFQIRENTHYNMNLINKLTEMDTRSMRAVLDLEYKLAALRHRAYQVRAENSWLNWFLNWVLFDIIGADMLTGITSSSTPEEKIQSVIEGYKNVRVILARRTWAADQTPVDSVFN